MDKEKNEQAIEFLSQMLSDVITGKADITSPEYKARAAQAREELKVLKEKLKLEKQIKNKIKKGI